ncbi:MAG: PRC-barrel domain-containing protein [Steroidobacteraceae bacterium]
MLRNVKKLDGFRILATDGALGSVRELYFDDEQWVVRYLVVDTAGWLSGRRVLVSPYAVKWIEWDTRSVAVNLTRDQVQQSPGIDTDRPVSRQQEAEYHQYYGYPQYWPYSEYWAWGAMPLVTPPNPLARTHAETNRRAQTQHAGADAHLRSSQAVLGHHIKATDSVVGHVADFLFDEESWAIRYLVVDTRNWLPGKHVLVTPQAICAVSWAERTLSVQLTREEIEGSPKYDPGHPPSHDFERELGNPSSHHGS